MKKYRTSEAIAMLENNPEAKLTAKIAGQTCEIRVDNEGYVMTHFSGTFEGFEGNIGINTEWELIQQSIPFMEAVKAYSEGKTIRCEWNGRSKKWESEYKNGSLYKGIEEYDGAVCPEEILNGKWYVEDSNE